MNELDVYRHKIEEIDYQIAKLFEDRMKVISKISRYKKKHNLEIFDLTRELNLIQKNIENIEDKDLVIYYEEIFKTFLKVSKDYQKDLLSK